MLGLMQRYPLLISSLIVHAARHRGGAEVVSNLERYPNGLNRLGDSRIS